MRVQFCSACAARFGTGELERASQVIRNCLGTHLYALGYPHCCRALNTRKVPAARKLIGEGVTRLRVDRSWPRAHGQIHGVVRRRARTPEAPTTAMAAAEPPQQKQLQQTPRSPGAPARFLVFARPSPSSPSSA